MNNLNDILTENYGFSNEELALVEGWAEGHGLQLTLEDNQVKLEDLYEEGDYWAEGISDVIMCLSNQAEDLLEETEEAGNMELAADYEEDINKLYQMYQRVNNTTHRLPA